MYSIPANAFVFTGQIIFVGVHALSDLNSGFLELRIDSFRVVVIGIGQGFRGFLVRRCAACLTIGESRSHSGACKLLEGFMATIRVDVQHRPAPNRSRYFIPTAMPIHFAGPIPADLSELTALTVLDLSGNRLSGE